jgi:large conductance mechanosensitive channel
MGMMQEFKEFALKGNVVDLAIGVVIGGAFGKIVDSLVGDIIMPLIGAIGGADFSSYFIPLQANVPAGGYAQLKEQGIPMLGYGQFITVAINFIIIAWVLFMVVKAMNTLKKKEAAIPAPPAPPPAQEVLLGQIRDLLAKR